jgi:hypothetical protein
MDSSGDVPYTPHVVDVDALVAQAPQLRLGHAHPVAVQASVVMSRIIPANARLSS